MCLGVVCPCITVYVFVGVCVCFFVIYALGVYVGLCVAFLRKQQSDTHCAHMIGALCVYVLCVCVCDLSGHSLAATHQAAASNKAESTALP